MTGGQGAIFVIPQDLRSDVLERALDGCSVSLDAPSAGQAFTVLDCHDQSLRKSGCLLIEIPAGLQLFSRDGTVTTGKHKGRGQFVQDFPNGALRRALAGFPTLRALTAIGEGDSSTQTLAVLDDQQKALVRGSVLSLKSGSGQVALVQLHRLRGCGRAFTRTCNTVASMGGVQAGYKAVYANLYPDMRPYRAKPDVPLGKTEPAVEAATDIIRTYLEVARQNEAGIVADIDTEYLHDYRVSLRRIRSVLSLFKGVYSDEQTQRLKQVFAAHMDPTGRLRDLDVYLLEKDSYFSLVPPPLHPGLHEMFARFETEREQELSRLTRRFRSAAYMGSMQVLAEDFQDYSRLQSGPNAKAPAYGYARKLIWKRYCKVCKLARNITPQTPDEAVHALRIHCKKLRYLMEFFAPLFDEKAFRKIIKPLRKLQNALGNFNDCSVQKQALLEFVTKPGTRSSRLSPQLAMAIGGLIMVLSQRQQAERDKAVESFERFDSAKTRDLFRSLFHTSEG